MCTCIHFFANLIKIMCIFPYLLGKYNFLGYARKNSFFFDILIKNLVVTHVLVRKLQRIFGVRKFSMVSFENIQYVSLEQKKRLAKRRAFSVIHSESGIAYLMS